MTRILLTLAKRQALGYAMQIVLQRLGVAVCGTEFGKQLGGWLFEFRLLSDLRDRVPPGEEVGRILFRVFCYAHGDRLILLLLFATQGSGSFAPAAERRDRARAGGGCATSSAAGWARGDVDGRWVKAHMLKLGSHAMSHTFDEFMQKLEEETRRAGPAAVARAEALKAQYTLAAEIILLRKRRGLTQRQLSARTGIQQSEISRIEGGRGNPTAATLAALVRALGGELRIVPTRGWKGPSVPSLGAAERSRANRGAAARAPRGTVRRVRTALFAPGFTSPPSDR